MILTGLHQHTTDIRQATPLEAQLQILRPIIPVSSLIQHLLSIPEHIAVAHEEAPSQQSVELLQHSGDGATPWSARRVNDMLNNNELPTRLQQPMQRFDRLQGIRHGTQHAAADDGVEDWGCQTVLLGDNAVAR